MSIETMTKLATVEVGSGGSSSISFSNIPQTYTDLVIKCSLREATGTNWFAYVNFNNSGGSQTEKILQGNGSAASSGDYLTSDIIITSSGATASTFGNAEIYIPNYTSNNYKSWSADSVSENNATTSYNRLSAHLWSNTSAITSIQFTILGSTNFAQYSTATLYGIRNMRQSLPPIQWASGGAISFDGTYFSHTFTSSGLFIPNKDMIIDYLVVAGGGAGGGASDSSSGPYSGGGGGAGGYRTSIGGSGLSLNVNNILSVIVGAGGATSNDFSRGNSGSNSSIGGAGITPITATGGGAGGGGAATSVSAALTGGSGGGGAAYTQTSGAAGNAGGYSPVEGYAGGNGNAYAISVGGGGGGAGAAGTSASSSNTGGQGGVGLANSISGSSVYYAGGGGGGTESSSGTVKSGGLGGGGTGGKPATSPTSGTANTGGGGGGAGRSQVGASGGSGIVIIRYKP